MKKATLGHIAEAADGQLLKGDAGIEISGATTDSRERCDGQLFVPLSGEKFDGHDFVGSAVENGAAAFLWARDEAPPVYGNAAVVRVKNTLKAYQAIALDNRKRCGAVVIGLTGSSGKTTTKALVSNMLSKRKTISTHNNENNEVGVPKTLLKIDAGTEYAVIEMGMRARGEIAESAAITRPDYGIITNVGVTHIELLGTEEEIALAKGEILEFVAPGGIVFLNADNSWTEMLKGISPASVITFGMDSGDVRSSNEKYTLDGVRFTVNAGDRSFEAAVQTPGKAGVYNALCAAALGLELGLPVEEIVECLALPVAEDGRMKRVEARNGALVLDDSYNANPCSMRMALDFLSRVEWKGRKVAALADMLELGERSREEHFKLGLESAGAGLDMLVTMGERAAEIAAGAIQSGRIAKENVRSFLSFEELAEEKNKLFRGGDLVLVKGSRGLKSERVVKLISEME